MAKKSACNTPDFYCIFGRPGKPPPIPEEIKPTGLGLHGGIDVGLQPLGLDVGFG